MRYNVSLDNFEDGASRAHLARYYLARGFVDLADTVIDAACGTGYGSQLLADTASEVLAYDQLDEIKYKGVGDNLVYQKMDLSDPRFNRQAAVSISLETIEHLKRDDAKKFIFRLLNRTNRFFIFSLPLGEVLGANPFHLQVFPNRETAWKLVEHSDFTPFHTFMQGTHLIGIMYRK